MWSDEIERRWRELSEEVIIGMKDWRIAHPTATFNEIEAALDERLAKVRARMLQDAALATKAADLTMVKPEERPRCPKCGQALEPHGKDMRSLTTSHQRTITLDRSYARCPACKVGLFPPR